MPTFPLPPSAAFVPHAVPLATLPCQDIASSRKPSPGAVFSLLHVLCSPPSALCSADLSADLSLCLDSNLPRSGTPPFSLLFSPHVPSSPCSWFNDHEPSPHCVCLEGAWAPQMLCASPNIPLPLASAAALHESGLEDLLSCLLSPTPSTHQAFDSTQPLNMDGNVGLTPT